MEYVSTRGGMSPRPFGEVVIGGLAPDGGLIVPAAYPRVSAERLNAWRELDYASLAYEVLKLYADDIPGEQLRRIVDASYTPELFGRP